MITLGLNHSNDSAAALVVDGQPVAAVLEERLDRVKHSTAFPQQAMNFCLTRGKVTLADLDQVAFFWNPGIHLTAFKASQASVWRHHSEYLTTLPYWLVSRWPQRPQDRRVTRMTQEIYLDGAKRPLHIEYVNHHLTHVAAAFFCSPYETAAVLTIDGYGERVSCLGAHGKGLKTDVLFEVEFPHTLGSVYSAVTQWLGFLPNCDEGKTMGLAPYGATDYLEDFRRIFRLTEDGLYRVDGEMFTLGLERPRRFSPAFEKRFGPARATNDPIEDRHRAVAASLQTAVEEVMIHMTRHLLKRTGERRLCMAGGVALNCVANGKLAEALDLEHLYVQPAAGDGGSSLGAALWVQHALNGVPRGAPMLHDFLGPSYTNEEIVQFLDIGGLPYYTPDHLNAHIARRLANGEIVGWFSEGAEYGPRSLGNRSILADPRNPGMKDHLNKRVKHREAFRPFAPSALAERAHDIFDFKGDSPFMLRAHPVKPAWRERLPAITHVDGSARIQTVNKTVHGRYHALISAFEKETGVPVIVNTSFNIKGEPIVTTPADAVKCYLTTGIDTLVMGDIVMSKKQA
ncbi:MAG TPA: carbamoyltransferase C-terminal domain-containing protein [Phycisphaerae bacterium]|jgi:carbamoyltransferase